MSDQQRPATGRLVRESDVSGISGTGHVADLVRWADDSVSVRWLGEHPSIVYWTSMASVEHVHGHGGATRIVWDNPQSAPPDLRAVQGRLTNVLQGDLEGWPDRTRWEDVWALARDVQPLVDEIAALREKLVAVTAERDADRDRGATPS